MIKDRILRIADYKGLNKEDFLKEIGQSYSNYRGKSKVSSPSSDVIVELSSRYPDVNISWVLTGQGSMIVSDSEEGKSSNSFLNILDESMITGVIDPDDAEILKKHLEILLLKEKKYEALKEKVRKIAGK